MNRENPLRSSKAENRGAEKQMRERDEIHIFVFLPSGLRPV